MKRFLPIVLVAFLATCCNTDVNISHMKTQDDGIMTFEVNNPTEKDIEIINIGFRYTDSNGDLIRTDTLEYKMAEESEIKVFLKANDHTWVSRKPPEGAVETEAFIVDYK